MKATQDAAKYAESVKRCTHHVIAKVDALVRLDPGAFSEHGHFLLPGEASCINYDSHQVNDALGTLHPKLVFTVTHRYSIYKMQYCGDVKLAKGCSFKSLLG